jgi:lactoylglutathione lyase
MKNKIPPIVLLALALCAGIPTKAQHKAPILNHIAIYVKDLAVSTAFYRDLIQLDTIPEPFHDGHHTWFRIGEHSQLHVISGATSIPAPDINSHICFSVPSISAFIDRLHAHKVPFRDWKGTPDKPTLRVDGVKQIYFQDPDGYWIEINDDKY